MPVVRFNAGPFDPGDLVIQAQTPLRLRVVNGSGEYPR